MRGLNRPPTQEVLTNPGEKNLATFPLPVGLAPQAGGPERHFVKAPAPGVPRWYLPVPGVAHGVGLRVLHRHGGHDEVPERGFRQLHRHRVMVSGTGPFKLHFTACILVGIYCDSLTMWLTVRAEH